MPPKAGYYIPPLIPGLQATGVSANGALNWLKGQTEAISAADLQALAGYQGPAERGMGGMRRQNFLRLWGAHQRYESVQQALGQADPYHLITAAEAIPMPRRKARGFETTVNVLVRDQSGAFYFTPTHVLHADAITHLEAVEAAVRNLRGLTTAQGEDRYPFTIMSFASIGPTIERVPEFAEEPE